MTADLAWNVGEKIVMDREYKNGHGNKYGLWKTNMKYSPVDSATEY